MGSAAADREKLCPLISLPIQSLRKRNSRRLVSTSHSPAWTPRPRASHVMCAELNVTSADITCDVWGTERHVRGTERHVRRHHT